MKIAVLGTGIVGRTLAAKLSSLNHSVTIGTRDPRATLARADTDAMGTPPFSAWKEQYPGVKLAPFADAAASSEIVFNALSGAATIGGLHLAKADNLANKILVDVSNPLDFSKGMPPSLFVSNNDSLGEQVQREFAQARVVKTLNTVNAHLMVEPKALAGGEHTMFVSGNDSEAKAQVTRILEEWFGWKDVIDLGDITTARGAEMLLAAWVRLYGTLKTPMFAFRVVR
jgi:predicted dinucleotide-binding enzyme